MKTTWAFQVFQPLHCKGSFIFYFWLIIVDSLIWEEWKVSAHVFKKGLKKSKLVISGTDIQLINNNRFSTDWYPNRMKKNMKIRYPTQISKLEFLFLSPVWRNNLDQIFLSGGYYKGRYPPNTGWTQNPLLRCLCSRQGGIYHSDVTWGVIVLPSILHFTKLVCWQLWEVHGKQRFLLFWGQLFITKTYPDIILCGSQLGVFQNPPLCTLGEYYFRKT